MNSEFGIRNSELSARGSDRGYWDVVPAFGRDRTAVILSEAEGGVEGSPEESEKQPSQHSLPSGDPSTPRPGRSAQDDRFSGSPLCRVPATRRRERMWPQPGIAGERPPAHGGGSRRPQGASNYRREGAVR